MHVATARIEKRALDDCREARHAGVYRTRFPLAGLARVAVLDLRRSISQRPAGPGGLSVRNTENIAMTRLASGISSSRIFTNDPFARSISITPTGIAPQPKPARKKACFAPRSA